MTPYELKHEPDTGIVRFRAASGLSEDDKDKLAAELGDAIAHARRRSRHVRFLWDNREGIVFSSTALRAVVSRMRQSLLPGDRTAIVVSSSLNKVRARQQTSEAQQIFISETAARKWLSAWQ